VETVEKRRENGELLGRETLTEQLADALEVRRRSRCEPLGSLLRQLRVDDARVRLARCLADETGTLEPVQKPRDSGWSQHDALREVNATHHLIGRTRDVQQHLIVVDRQPVIGDELAVELARDRRVRAQEVDERSHLDALK